MEMLCEALNRGKCVALVYGDHKRIVEVHLVGKETVEAIEYAIVWQVSGGSNSGAEQGWKTLRVNDISALEIIDQASNAPRNGYVQQRSQYTGIVDEIVCEV